MLKVYLVKQYKPFCIDLSTFVVEQDYITMTDGTAIAGVEYKQESIPQHSSSAVL